MPTPCVLQCSTVCGYDAFGITYESLILFLGRSVRPNKVSYDSVPICRLDKNLGPSIESTVIPLFLLRSLSLGDSVCLSNR